MIAPPELYARLGVAPTASADEIKAAYRALARTHHPDRGGDAAAFRRITEAYEVLGDARRRREYDAQHRTRHVSDLLGISEARRTTDLLFGGRPADPSPGRPRTMRLAVPERVLLEGGVVDIVLPEGTRQAGRRMSVDIPAQSIRSPVLVLHSHGEEGEAGHDSSVRGESGALYIILSADAGR